ncbi:transcriptional regulator, CdaR [Paenibacillus curdlanolyticus YK9]|uniref:Transcriptional regulator, CdaR n=1 Tax=Paenibacillus curdlanolyticus YK9 TaxID=717606 RepID=E0IE34_9BACL|nr:PucR family transcriptional regulator [Paenibacillus curdlanolyticus]EFM09388.1 transcriptional regulator, CdaR [Paenibacillus curdlanolyticus YK9]
MVNTVLQITVKEVLQRPHFHQAHTIASERALGRIVQWAHLAESLQAAPSQGGHELILSSAEGWLNEETTLPYLRQLIDSGASGLCLATTGGMDRLPDSVIRLAEREHFPLILLKPEVRYIDITQDLHRLFLNRHHQMVAALEALSARFNQLLLSGKGILPLLKLLNETANAQVAFFPVEGEPAFVPPMPKPKADALLADWISGKQQPDSVNHPPAHRPILALDHLFADLLLIGRQELSEFQKLALDRCATAVAQEMMRTTYMEERNRQRADLWLLGWLEGKQTEEQAKEYLAAAFPSLSQVSAAVVLFEWGVGGEHCTVANGMDGSIVQLNLKARKAFEGEGFYVQAARTEEELVYLVFDRRGRPQLSERLLRAIHKLKQDGIGPFAARLAGIGAETASLSGIPDSYASAKETIRIQKRIGPLDRPLYSELHVYRILSVMYQSGGLPPFVNEYLGPIIRCDSEKNGHLLLTLKTYLHCAGSKQETAKALFIVRQTLYHRLDKIAVLLGEDFMQPDKRMAVELALRGYEYVHGVIR